MTPANPVSIWRSEKKRKEKNSKGRKKNSAAMFQRKIRYVDEGKSAHNKSNNDVGWHCHCFQKIPIDLKSSCFGMTIIWCLPNPWSVLFFIYPKNFLQIFVLWKTKREIVFNTLNGWNIILMPIIIKKLTLHWNIAMTLVFDIQIPRDWQYYTARCVCMAHLLEEKETI